MASILAIVSKAAFEQDADLAVGDLYETGEYQSKNKALEPLAEGGSLYLVTARGDALWLVGVLERPIFIGDRWTASANTVRIVDITERASQLRFSTGKGIDVQSGNLGMVLQAPRKLTDADVELLRTAAGLPAAPPPAARPPAAAPAVKRRR